MSRIDTSRYSGAAAVTHPAVQPIAPRPGFSDTRRPAASERKQMSAGMTTTLSAELEGRVARDLVADIVRAVVDESRQRSPDGTVESLMAEARQRLERFIRARAGR